MVSSTYPYPIIIINTLNTAADNQRPNLAVETFGDVLTCKGCSFSKKLVNGVFKKLTNILF